MQVKLFIWYCII